MIGNELDEKIGCPLPKESRKVLIAGGGPGGMEAALEASERGHKVILCEKDSELGGVLNFAKYVDFKQDLYKFSKSLETRLRKTDTEIRLNTEVTPELIREINPDVTFLAVGSEPITPPIPGIDRENVYSPSDAEKMPLEELGENIVVMYA